jgi:hypothetical protein
LLQAIGKPQTENETWPFGKAHTEEANLVTSNGDEIAMSATQGAYTTASSSGSGAPRRRKSLASPDPLSIDETASIEGSCGTDSDDRDSFNESLIPNVVVECPSQSPSTACSGDDTTFWDYERDYSGSRGEGVWEELCEGHEFLNKMWMGAVNVMRHRRTSAKADTVTPFAQSVLNGLTHGTEVANRRTAADDGVPVMLVTDGDEGPASAYVTVTDTDVIITRTASGAALAVPLSLIAAVVPFSQGIPVRDAEAGVGDEVVELMAILLAINSAKGAGRAPKTMDITMLVEDEVQRSLLAARIRSAAVSLATRRHHSHHRINSLTSSQSHLTAAAMPLHLCPGRLLFERRRQLPANATAGIVQDMRLAALRKAAVLHGTNVAAAAAKRER